MRKFLWLHAGMIPLCALLTPLAAAQDDTFSIGGSVQEIWDSNYSRSPEGEEDSEYMTLATASVAFNKTLSRQKFNVHWQGNRYKHAELSELDADYSEGGATWRGEWGSRLKTNLQWLRDAYPVDRLEFSGRDIISRDDAALELDYGLGHKFTMGLGARQINQMHSNEEREGLDYEDEEGFFEVGYQTGIKSTLTLRGRYGERAYPNEQLVPVEDTELPSGNLNYDYQQIELEGVWIASPKTNITSTFGYFNRDGDVNDGTGTVIALDANWELTPKLLFEGGYALSQPAVGETSDSLTETQTASLGLKWLLTHKLGLHMRASFSEQQYEDFSLEQERTEHFYVATPLAVTYELAKSISIKAATSWTERQSPLAYREYTSAEATLGIYLRY